MYRVVLNHLKLLCVNYQCSWCGIIGNPRFVDGPRNFIAKGLTTIGFETGAYPCCKQR